jgi:uncharacterized protein YbbC (DUF1343 family)
MRLFWTLWMLLIVSYSCVESAPSQKQPIGNPSLGPILTGADQLDLYVPLLKGKRLAILGNQTTVVGQTHLVDTLLSLGMDIRKVFGPEHGFRGNASAGVAVKDEVDPQTGIPMISLYGKKKQPSAADLSEVDLFIFDVQDVGCRFYTYINVLREIMEACAANGKPLLILDRPNPNGYLIDGPILDLKFKSGIGQFPVPISHGMTMGEFAQMIQGEGWMRNGRICSLKIIPVANYTHDMEYVLPIPPSPNLNTQQSILLYPATCLFEGTYVNLGRGTQFPFTILGAPLLKGKYEFSFVPKSIKGMSETPLFMNQTCYGIDLRNFDASQMRKTGRIPLKWMLELYQAFPEKSKFFDRSLSKEMGNIDFLAGNDQFKQQVIAGKTEAEIHASWDDDLVTYKNMRSKYLLYP